MDKNLEDVFSASSSAILGTSKHSLSTSIENGQVVVVSADNSQEELIRTPVKAAYERISSAATLTRRRLNDIYKQHQIQSQHWFRASIIAAVIGFFVVVVGSVAIFLGFVHAAIVSSVLGILCEVISALFYKQAKSANDQIRSDVLKLIDAERIHQAVELALTIEDQKLRDDLKASIIKLVLQGQSSANSVKKK